MLPGCQHVQLHALEVNGGLFPFMNAVNTPIVALKNTQTKAEA